MHAARQRTVRHACAPSEGASWLTPYSPAPCPPSPPDAGGVYDGRHCDNSRHDINHAMLLVGWSGNDHWIIKNSW
jgi:hypothetical protein